MVLRQVQVNAVGVYELRMPVSDCYLLAVAADAPGYPRELRGYDFSVQPSDRLRCDGSRQQFDFAMHRS